MRKKVTKEQTEKIIVEVADKVKRELDFDFRVAYSQMGIAENDASKTIAGAALYHLNNQADKHDDDKQLEK